MLLVKAAWPRSLSTAVDDSGPRLTTIYTLMRWRPAAPASAASMVAGVACALAHNGSAAHSAVMAVAVVMAMALALAMTLRRGPVRLD